MLRGAYACRIRSCAEKPGDDLMLTGNAMQVRACTNTEEMRAAFAPIWHYFGQNQPSEDGVKHFVRVLPHERVLAGFDGDDIVAGVFPTHRRRGYLRALQRSLIDDARAHGEPVAVLWATEDPIYGQFGYGMASMTAEIDLPRDRAAPFAPVTATGQARLVPLGEAGGLGAPVSERVACVTPGMFARTPEWWQDRVLNDMDWKRRGGGFMQCAVLEVDGAPVAYALYRMNAFFEHGL